MLAVMILLVKKVVGLMRPMVIMRMILTVKVVLMLGLWVGNDACIQSEQTVFYRHQAELALQEELGSVRRELTQQKSLDAERVAVLEAETEAKMATQQREVRAPTYSGARLGRKHGQGWR